MRDLKIALLSLLMGVVCQVGYYFGAYAAGFEPEHSALLCIIVMQIWYARWLPR